MSDDVDDPDRIGPDLSKPRIRRWEVVQGLLDLFDDPRYLEIGVNKGTTFHHVGPKFRVAVDPRFRFDWEGESRRRGVSAEYHQVTSDVYFGSIIDVDQQFDVIYLDGLHTFEQTLRDFNNALQHLAPRGVILIDDVKPSSYPASLANRAHAKAVRAQAKDQRKAWMGDVYRLVWFIDTFYQSLSYATVGNNHGQAVVWRQRRPSVPERGAAEIAELSYESFVISRNVLNRRPFGEIVRDLARCVGRATVD